MNTLLQNPFAHDTPDNVERVLEYAQASCIRYNRGSGAVGSANSLLFAGSFLAAGRVDGVVTIWDPHTAGILRWMVGHSAAVTSLSWSRYNRFLASASYDHTVIVWDLNPESEEVHSILRFDGPVHSVEFDPTNSSILLVVLSATQDVVLVNVQPRFQVERTRTIKASSDDLQGPSVGPWGGASITPLPPRRWRFGGNLQGEQVGKSQTISCACFASVSSGLYSSASNSPSVSEAGVYVFAGTAKGGLAVYNAHTRSLVQSDPSAFGTSAVLQIIYHPGYGLLVANCKDRKIRVCTVQAASLPSSDDKEASSANSKLFDFHTRYIFQDQIGRTRWNSIGLSADGEYIYAGAVNLEKHSVYVWERVSGALNKIIEGPKEPLAAVDWHPARPAMASLGSNGDINLWSVLSEGNWSAYAPGFEELDENMEYEEREDEFDVEDEDEANQRQRDEEVGLIELYPPGEAVQRANYLRSLSHPSPEVETDQTVSRSDPFWEGTAYAHTFGAALLSTSINKRSASTQPDAVDETWTRIVALEDSDSDATFRIMPRLEEEPILLEGSSPG